MASMEWGALWLLRASTGSSEEEQNAVFWKNGDDPPKYPQWLRSLDKSYFGKFLQIIAQRDVQNMGRALDALDKEGTQSYIYVNIGNARSEIAFDFGVGGYGPSSTRRVGRSIRATSKTGVSANRLNHIFGKSEHALESFVKKFDSQERAYNAVQNAANQALKAGKLTPNAKGILP